MTLIQAIRRGNVIESKICDQNVKAETFVDFLKTLPLHKDDVIVMDNAPIHRAKLTVKYIQSMESSVLFLPPYCPKYNPIEYSFGIYKHQYRKLCSPDMEFEDCKILIHQIAEHSLGSKSEAIFNKVNRHILSDMDGFSKNPDFVFSGYDP